MKKLLLTAACVMAVIGFAVAQQPTQREFNLKVDSKDIELIGEGLGALPYHKVMPLMTKLQAQINSQINPNLAPMPADPKAAVPPPIENVK